ncbi:TusE/DsrC/DsvC family sulfur relay protein [Permianibacter sp. IMCC34836]|uniref:TusE/DsrC/DsvC family sulfur relay protein n=1 Tax=Permianibacter fluminis TaxID=2738515 RepID=UPI001554C637|nr:TusE/DsrC/DsvC family sulfur relay protein [Permianibacter fluminis]NQD38178.1 TusE/DsrC/DsvC family sulfur relay protein [Permianibacter fluminis]
MTGSAGNFIEINGQSFATDGHGYLRDRSVWTEAIAEQLAAREGIVLTAEHWQVIRYVRAFYDEFQSSPAIRPLVKYLAQHWGPEKGNSLYLHTLFKEPAKQASKIAGLPKPARCI